jgi:ferredoxin
MRSNNLPNEDGIFRHLQQHLDKQAVGFPAVRAGADIRLLKRLFTPDEAKIARLLSCQPAPIGQVIAGSAPAFSAGQTERLIESMLMKGAIGWKEKDGISHWYLIPLVVGMYEGQDGEPTPEFMADAGAYMKTLSFGKSFLAVKPSQMRTIPIHQSLPVDHPVATYDQIRAIIKNARGPFVVLKCICRVHASFRGKPCGKTSRLETCLGLDDIAAMLLRRKHGREIARDEALAILRQNEDDGLVLQPANARQPEFICACCGCCCGMLSFQKSLPHPLDFWTSNFYAQVALDACTRCGKCVARCQVKAVTLTGPNGKAKINLSRCIGCGLCVPTCPAKALQLKKKETETIPPQNQEELSAAIMANKKGAWGQFLMLLKTALRMRQ